MDFYHWRPTCTKASTKQDRASRDYVTCPGFCACHCIKILIKLISKAHNDWLDWRSNSCQATKKNKWLPILNENDLNGKSTIGNWALKPTSYAMASMNIVWILLVNTSWCILLSVFVVSLLSAHYLMILIFKFQVIYKLWAVAQW